MKPQEQSDIRVLAVIGEGLAAGIGDFSLYAETQAASFPAVVAGALGVPFQMRLFEAPGIGMAPGFPASPALTPGWLQSRVVLDMPPKPVHHLAVPGFTLSDALHFRPSEPVVQNQDPRQTAANLILGMDRIPYGELGLTQLESAVALHPDLTLVALGYTEILESALLADPNLIPELEFVRGCWGELIDRLRDAGSEVLLVNVPDPFDTAGFADLQTASRILRVDADVLVEAYELDAGDRITVHGLNQIGIHFFGRVIDSLPPGAICPPSTVSSIRARVAEWNDALLRLAEARGAWTYDLAGLLRCIREGGAHTGTRVLSADYMGGFYSLNGCYPGTAGHAIIARDLLAMLGRLGLRYSPVDVDSAATVDPVVSYRPASGRNWTAAELPHPLPRRGPAPGPPSTTPPQPFAAAVPLRLPPGNQQTLAINSAASHFGDGIAALNCREPRDIQWGSSGHWLFGGLAMVDSHLRGSLHFRFSEPVDNRCAFEVTLGGGLEGEDAMLAAPVYFQMPFQHNRVDDIAGLTSHGVLDLVTGEVSDLTVYARYSSTALLSLVSVNPTFPKQPLTFPGQYGSAWARFEQRPDGLLDFEFRGSTYVPLGNGIVWPLNFAGPDQEFATVPAKGTVMHPHLNITTKASAEDGHDGVLEIPWNTVQEYTLHAHNSAFGDAFGLQVPALGGPAKGRSHVMGRVQIQFGVRTGDSVPIAVWILGPGGIFTDLPDSPLTEAFPGRLSAGAQGFYELLRFPLRSYALDDLSILSDPFDISVGLLNLRTGRLLGPLLHRGFIHQDLIFALLRVEPRTPKSSFDFRGPAALERNSGNAAVFRFEGVVRIPYPPGFLFPQPNLTTSFVVGEGSALDPYLWLQAMAAESPGDDATGEMRGAVSSVGESFSFRYRIPAAPGNHPALFEYQNHSQNGSFRMHSLAWVSFTRSRGATVSDTVTFSGWGVWSKDETHSVQQVAAQFCTSAAHPYVGIQIGLAEISNVNTRPQREEDARP